MRLLQIICGSILAAQAIAVYVLVLFYRELKTARLNLTTTGDEVAASASRISENVSRSTNELTDITERLRRAFS